jgi:hypothetical protein
MGKAVTVAEQFERWLGGQLEGDSEMKTRLIALILVLSEENAALRKYQGDLLGQIASLQQSLLDARTTLYALAREKS